ncbi:hypothetical protein OIO90_006645, partial [Microbotryomycetes sp. JL221]
GAFEVLLGRSWLQQAHVTDFAAIERMVYPTKDSWHHLINQNAEAKVPAIDLSTTADLIATAQLVQRFMLEQRLATTKKSLLIAGFNSELQNDGYLDDQQVKCAADAILAKQGTEPAVDFWSSVKGQHTHPDVQRWSTMAEWDDQFDLDRLPASMFMSLQDLLESVPDNPRPSESERTDEVLRLVHFGDSDNEAHLTTEQASRMQALVTEFADVMALSLDELGTTDTVICKIPLVEGACATRPRYTRTFNNPKHREFLVKEVGRLLKAGKICHVDSDKVTWVSNVTVAPKANLDFRAKPIGQIEHELDQAINEWKERLANGEPPDHVFMPQRNDLPDDQKSKLRLCYAFLDLNDATLGAPFPVGDINAKIGRLS